MNSRASWLSLVTLAAGALLVVAPGSDVRAQGQGLAVGRPEWVQAVRHDTSRPLREITPTPAVSTRDDFEVKEPAFAPPSGQADTSMQTFPVAPLAAATMLNFDGVGRGNPQFPYTVSSAPPDTTGEAGLTQYVQWVNASFAVFDKSNGLRQYGPAGGNTLFAGFGGDCESRNDGDPIVQYDQLADRWILTQFSIRAGNYLQCVAVSQTSDALGAWHRYAYSYADMPDYPKLSVWPDAYYITFNMFAGGSSFTGGRVCAYDRAKMLTGQPATQVCFQNPSYGSFLAADLDGKALPAAGTPNYVLTLGGGMSLFKFTVNFSNPSASTFTGPTSIPVAGYTNACVQNCVPQPGTTQKLDVLGGRLMYRLSYRNLGSREALLVNHSVAAGGVNTIRWYEFNITGGTPSVRQQSTYAPGDGLHRWMGSIGMDKVGNIAVGYSTGSATSKPSIKFAGREVQDPLNTLSTETNLHSGTGSQTTTLSRWGDYSSMTIDPVDDCTFWYTSEYLQTDGTFNWSTRIGSFKFSTCTGTTEPPPPDPSFALSATPSSRTVTQGQSTTYTATVSAQNGYTGSGSFSVSGLPTGGSASFSPAGYSGGGGSSTLTVNTAATTPAGTYPLTISATGSGTPTQNTTVTLVVNAAPVAADFTLSVSPGNRTVKRGNSVSYAVTITPSGGFNETVTFTVSGVPSNTTSAFSPTSVAGGGTATLTIGTSNPSTPKGTSTLTITATSASKTRSATVTLKVQ